MTDCSAGTQSVNSRLERPLGYFGGGNKIVSILIVTVQPFFSAASQKKSGNVPIYPSVSLNIPATSTQVGNLIPCLQLKR
jgi:hypothetical protein